ncbi:oxygen independent coprophorphyrinogen III oxidase 1 [Crocosphaera subtropica ATCC 51142]|uniref:Coproporphyrinogen-III oxidase n=1 Tax=Crocosphaera subtropica (strain ATCC 51142 / BH68) TaxID=43989 RepID=B1WQG4_CROS5|nr:oxygen-independent coproporphyrinogen III oxidase [Crocosphaera subtropica]ACB51675.1 oxygen independent coprophorphyrinogen III oxidase 1 [Crocosphaera subtropica ATCC 51142]
MNLTAKTIEFDKDLIKKYDKSLPRYTSYPPATELKTKVGEVEFRAGIAAGNHKKTPLSLYCHIPFCETACYFCGCNTIITGNKKVADPYLEYLIKDIERTAELISPNRAVNQIHWGGGTPNYLNQSQIDRLFNTLVKNFNIDKDAEISIEVNPRYLDRNLIFFLRQLGFNRISFGIQDFDPKVQKVINRVQPEEMLFNVMGWMREAEFESVNVDLIYGLPYQNRDTFKKTVQKTIELDPDRIAVFNFAYIPWIKPAQKNLPVDELPNASEKLAMLQMTIEEFNNNDYLFIGMDHFAKANDELAIAQSQGDLHRNFQGYTTKPESDLLAFGMTSISMLHDVYVQNHKKIKDYYKALDEGHLPIEKGVTLSKDDIIRRAVIMELMCQSQLYKDRIEEKYNLNFDLDFDEYFAQELIDLKPLEADGLIHLHSDRLEVTNTGRWLIRNIAAVFDPYLKGRKEQSFSKAI